MARINQSGFELNSLTNGVEFTIVNNSPTISTGTVRSGTYSLKISSLTSGLAQNIRMQFATAGSGGDGPYFGRQFLNIETLPTAENRIISCRDSSAGSDKIAITLDSGGLLRVYNSAGTQIGSASSALSTGVWYQIEWKVDRTPAGGSQVLEAKLNGSVFATSSSQTITTNAGDLVRLGGNLQGEGQTQGVWYFDDVAINDGTGSFQNSYPGNGKIIHLKPNAAGDANGFATQVGGTAGSSNNFTRVNEIPPNDVTSYNASATLNVEDLFNCDDSGLTTPTVNVVAVGGRYSNISSADATTAFKFEIEKTGSGTKAQSAAIVPNTTTWRTNSAGGVVYPYPLITYQDPDASAWTQTTLDSLQVGYIISTGSVNPIGISNVWVSIDYTPSGSSPSLSPSASVSASPSGSVSASISPSPSLSVSLSPSSSVSPSSSISLSASLSPSLSPSRSPSLSPSLSVSLSPSLSVSSSVSPSNSVSLSPSLSPSLSISLSVSLSPSRSPSLSFSPSPSLSLSPSPSLSISRSPSVSVSASVSLSASLSASVTPSSSVSASPSFAAKLYLIHQYKFINNSNRDRIYIRINLRSTLSFVLSPVYLQIWNASVGSWETLVINNVDAQDTDVDLEYNLTSNVQNYYDSNYEVAVRVYQYNNESGI